MPSAKKGKVHKFARPFHGPFRVIGLTANDAKVCPVNRPKADPIFISLDRVHDCPVKKFHQRNPGHIVLINKKQEKMILCTDQS